MAEMTVMANDTMLDIMICCVVSWLVKKAHRGDIYGKWHDNVGCDDFITFQL